MTDVWQYIPMTSQKRRVAHVYRKPTGSAGTACGIEGATDFDGVRVQAPSHVKRCEICLRAM